jgi:hypothetical protein
MSLLKWPLKRGEARHAKSDLLDDKLEVIYETSGLVLVDERIPAPRAD